MGPLLWRRRSAIEAAKRVRRPHRSAHKRRGWAPAPEIPGAGAADFGSRQPGETAGKRDRRDTMSYKNIKIEITGGIAV